MRYSDAILKHFFNPENVGIFGKNEGNVRSCVMGNRENGALIHLHIQVINEVIHAAKFKAYGTAPLIAACSYATKWLHHKSLEEAKLLTSAHLIEALDIPALKIHCALLVEDALQTIIKDAK